MTVQIVAAMVWFFSLVTMLPLVRGHCFAWAAVQAIRLKRWHERDVDWDGRARVEDLIRPERAPKVNEYLENDERPGISK